MNVVVVSDSGPLISLSRIGRADLFPALFTKVLIPSSVHTEVIGQAQARPGLELRDAAWLQVMPNPASIDQLKAFGAGERSAIALAQTLSAKLIIDDQKARTAAEQLGVSCAGTLNLIGQAKSLGLKRKKKGQNPNRRPGRRSGGRDLASARAAASFGGTSNLQVQILSQSHSRCMVSECPA